MSRKVFPADFPTRLWITGIPVVTAQQVEQDMADVIYWECHRPMTREHRIKRDEAFIRLRQSHWHLQQYLRSGEMTEHTSDRLRTMKAILGYSSSGVAVAALAACLSGNPIFAIPLIPWVAGFAAYIVTLGEQDDEEEETRIHRETEQ